MPLYGTGYIFSKPFFTGWVVVGIIWIFCSFIGVGLFPIYEGRETLARTCKYIWWDVTGKKNVKAIHAEQARMAGEVVVTEGMTPGDQTPSEEKSVKGEKREKVASL